MPTSGMVVETSLSFDKLLIINKFLLPQIDPCNILHNIHHVALPATHTFTTYGMNHPALLPSHRALLPFGQNSFPSH